MCKLSPDVVQTAFSDRATSCSVRYVIRAHRCSLMCTYAQDVNYSLMQSREIDGVSRRAYLNLHESIHVLYEKTPFDNDLIVQRCLILVPRLVDCYDYVTDGHCIMQLDRDPRTSEATFATPITTSTAVLSLFASYGIVLVLTDVWVETLRPCT